MALFSQRKGIRPMKKALQREGMDIDLRNGLWSALDMAIWGQWRQADPVGRRGPNGARVDDIAAKIWVFFFKLPADAMGPLDPRYSDSPYAFIRSRFFDGEWWEVYDLIEFVLKNAYVDWKGNLKGLLNTFMQRENSAYRVVDDEVVEITDDNEIEAIESALDTGTKESRSHLARAIDLLADRKSPDYRNSIKESISAVESVCQVLTGRSKATLGDCVKSLKKAGTIHPAFEKALLTLYGYTSDEGGIRHALTDESVTPKYSDAKFMLVTCSAFVNFVWTRASELGIDIRK